MIAINLLPIGEFKHRHRGQVFLAALGLVLLVLVAGLYTFKTTVMDANILRLESENSQASTQLNKVKKEVNEANVLTASTVKKWQQLEAIIELEERRRDLTRILVELDALLPQDNAWFLSMAHSEGALTLEGLSKDKEIISQFLARLEQAEYIARNSVNLVEIAQNMVINEISLTRFKISAQTVFPQPAVLDTGLPEQGLPSREEMLKVVEAAAPDLVAALKADAETKAKKTL